MTKLHGSRRGSVFHTILQVINLAQQCENTTADGLAAALEDHDLGSFIHLYTAPTARMDRFASMTKAGK